MKRIMRRIVVLLAALAVAAFLAGPSLAGMNDGGGFYSQVSSGSTCGPGNGNGNAYGRANNQADAICAADSSQP